MRKMALVAAATLALSAAGIGAWAVLTKPNGTLVAVTATSSASAWAIGYTGTWEKPGTLIEHWNGSSWQPVGLPAGLGHADLSGIAATSARNAWAVGNTTGATASAVMLHWDGRSWHRVTLPWDPRHSFLSAVAATSASNAWAFGDITDRHGIPQVSQGLHWNGSRWRLVPGLPAQAGRVGMPLELALSSAGTGWAVGRVYDPRPVIPQQEEPATVAWQLRGGTWYRATVPGLWGIGEPAVAAAGPADAFATSYGNGGSVVEHWDGNRWALAPGRPYGNGAVLGGVAALSASDAWAVGAQLPSQGAGDYAGSPIGPVIMHWNGLRWTKSLTPALSGAALTAVAATSPSSAWAIGRTGSDRPLVLYWNGRTWTEQL